MICAIVFAAGRAERMGRQKLLLPWGGKTVIGHVVDEIAASVVQKVFVVVRPESDAIEQALAGRTVTFVVNPHENTEMLESLRCALRVMPEDCEAVLVALGDQPLISRDLVNQIATAFHATGRGIIVPTAEERRGHPMLFATRFRDEILREFVGVGLKALRAKHPAEVHELPIAESVTFDDIDTPEDYERLHALRFSTKSGA